MRFILSTLIATFFLFSTTSINAQNNILLDNVSIAASVTNNIKATFDGTGCANPTTVDALTMANVDANDIIVSAGRFGGGQAFTPAETAAIQKALDDGKRVVLAGDQNNLFRANYNALLTALGSTMSLGGPLTPSGCVTGSTTLFEHPLTENIAGDFSVDASSSVTVGSGLTLISVMAAGQTLTIAAVEQISNGELVVTTDVNIWSGCVSGASQDLACNLLSAPVLVAPIPTMGQWTLMIFGLIVLTMGVVFVYNRQVSVTLNRA